MLSLISLVMGFLLPLCAGFEDDDTIECIDEAPSDWRAGLPPKDLRGNPEELSSDDRRLLIPMEGAMSGCFIHGLLLDVSVVAMVPFFD